MEFTISDLIQKIEYEALVNLNSTGAVKIVCINRNNLQVQ